MATVKSPTAKLMKTPSKPAAKDAAKAAPAKAAPPKTALKAKAKAEEKEAVGNAVEVAEENDMIVEVVHEVENLKQEKAYSTIPRLLNNIDHDYFKLGGYLSKVQAEAWYQDKGYETFKAYVEAETGMQYRKGMYLIAIYNGLSESGVKWDQVKHLGWTKLKELAPHLSVDNVEQLAEAADSMTVLQLQEYLKELQKGEDAGDSSEDTDKEAAKGTTTITFKVHPDQKTTIREAIDKAKLKAETEYDAVALENIALDYLSGDSKLKKMPALKDILAKKSIEEVLQALEQAFPKVVLQASVYDTEEDANAAKAELEAADDEAGEEDAGDEDNGEDGDE